MNASGEESCWSVVPAWALTEGGAGGAAACPPNLESFVKRTVPCPPPTNPCLFWAAAHRTNLSQLDADLVAATCSIPNFLTCSQTPQVESASVGGACGLECRALIGVFLVVFPLIVSLAFVVWQWPRVKRFLTSLCSGVCICCDQVFIQKKGLNRSESRSPTLADSGDKKETDPKDKHSNGFVNDGICLHLESVMVKYNRTDKDPDPLKDDCSEGEYEDLVECRGGYTGQQPPPDVITMVTESDPADGTKRLSYC